MKTSSILRLALYASIFSGNNCVSAFWRLTCQSSIGLARVDPLVSFDKPGAHVHSLKGGSAFSATSKGEDLLKSNCTSCGVKEDKSAYWTPAMYFVGDDGKTEIVPEMPPHKSYYFVEPVQLTSGEKKPREPFPVGFQMIAGNARKRNTSLADEGAVSAKQDPLDTDPNSLGPWPNETQEQLAERAVGFNCLHYGQGDEQSHSRHSLPSKEWLDAKCPDGLRLELVFPSCWNGKPDSEGHNKHVAYPTTLQDGDCPEGFQDHRLPTLFYETIVAIQNFKGKAGQFVLANGDPTGYGYHGDFIAAWEGDSLKNAIDACAYGGGNIEDCKAFTTVDSPSQEACQMQDPLPNQITNEDTKGPMNGLPGKVAIQSGPEEATVNAPSETISSLAYVSTSSTIAKAPVLTQSSAAAAAEASHPVDAPNAAIEHGQGAVFAEKINQKQANVPSPTSLSLATTPLPPKSPVADPGSVVTTKYYTEGQEVHKVVEIMVETTVTADPAKRTAMPDAQPHKRHHHHHYHQHRAANAHGIGGRRIIEV